MSSSADKPTLYADPSTYRVEPFDTEPEHDTEPGHERPEMPPPAPDEFTIAHGGTRGEDCAVDCNCVRGQPDEWFEVHFGATGAVHHFCARHALAAEALVTLGGWRAGDVAAGLRMLERGNSPSKAATG